MGQPSFDVYKMSALFGGFMQVLSVQFWWSENTTNLSILVWFSMEQIENEMYRQNPNNSNYVSCRQFQIIAFGM